MKSRRLAGSTALVFCMISAVAINVPQLSSAQHKPEAKPSPTPEKNELLKVEPAQKPLAPDASPQKAAQKLSLICHVRHLLLATASASQGRSVGTLAKFHSL